MTTKTCNYRLLTTKLITEIFNFQLSIFNFIKPPGKAHTQSLLTLAFCTLPFVKKELSHLVQQASSESFFLWKKRN